MKKQILFTAFFITLVFAFACTENSPSGSSVNVYKYTGYNSSGSKIISGFLTIVQDTSTVITGDWQFTPIGNCNEVGPQLGSGNFIGGLDSLNTLHINLNPGMVDNNVFLIGNFEYNHYVGTWSYTGFPGIINQGTFEAHKR